MTTKVKTGFILSIVAHLLAWAPLIYWATAFYVSFQAIEGSDSSAYTELAGHFDYSLVSLASTAAIALAIASLVLLGRGNDPQVKAYKTWGRVLSISGLALIGLTSAAIVFTLLYIFVFYFGL